MYSIFLEFTPKLIQQFKGHMKKNHPNELGEIFNYYNVTYN